MAWVSAWTSGTGVAFKSNPKDVKDARCKTSAGKIFQEKHHKIFSLEFPVKLSCWCVVITVITVLVVVICVALSARKENPAIESPGPCYDNCPRDWIGFESKCFYFSEDMRNWTFSQTFCMELEAHLAQIDTLEDLNFLKRYKGVSDHWIGLHRESSQHPWRWTDNTEYNNLVPTQGEGECAYLSDSVISSGRNYIQRRWICTKPSCFNWFTMMAVDVVAPIFQYTRNLPSSDSGQLPRVTCQ
ncbi:C-type lectin domain family 2 member H-like [Acomys russatus]|uniref:C-type lectin domain family 2 member H-like n=1 Tax=Acomys russatus TaxID=60746 RepID=UPI0021E28F98|nr:C-type lectin domain family 2 member H-like [Acomys russatus]